MIRWLRAALQFDWPDAAERHRVAKWLDCMETLWRAELAFRDLMQRRKAGHR